MRIGLLAVACLALGCSKSKTNEPASDTPEAVPVVSKQSAAELCNALKSAAETGAEDEALAMAVGASKQTLSNEAYLSFVLFSFSELECGEAPRVHEGRTQLRALIGDTDFFVSIQDKEGWTVNLDQFLNDYPPSAKYVKWSVTPEKCFQPFQWQYENYQR